LIGVDCAYPGIVPQGVECAYPGIVPQGVECAYPSIVPQGVECACNPGIVPQLRKNLATENNF